MSSVESSGSTPAVKASGLITIKELSTFLDRSVPSLYRDLAAGRLPEPVSLGGMKRWRQGEVKAWIRAGCPSREAWAGRWPAK